MTLSTDEQQLDTDGRVDAEQYVLAAAMTTQEAYAAAARHVNANAFHRPVHGVVWAAIAHLRDNDQPCDPILVAERLRATGEHLTLKTGIVHQVYGLPWVPSNVGHYARIIARAATRRATHEACVRLAQAAKTDDPGYFRAELATALERLTALARAWDSAGGDA